MADEEERGRNWDVTAPHVRKFLKWLGQRYRAAQMVLPQEAVDWDARNGRKIFDWDDRRAAKAHRLYQARLFLNIFSEQFRGVKIAAFRNIAADPAQGIERGYYPATAINNRPELREKLIEDIERRILELTKQLKAWKAPQAFRDQLVSKIQAVFDEPEPKKKAS